MRAPLLVVESSAGQSSSAVATIACQAHTTTDTSVDVVGPSDRRQQNRAGLTALSCRARRARRVCFMGASSIPYIVLRLVTVQGLVQQRRADCALAADLHRVPPAVVRARRRLL